MAKFMGEKGSALEYLDMASDNAEVGRFFSAARLINHANAIAQGDYQQQEAMFSRAMLYRSLGALRLALNTCYQYVADHGECEELQLVVHCLLDALGYSDRAEKMPFLYQFDVNDETECREMEFKMKLLEETELTPEEKKSRLSDLTKTFRRERLKNMFTLRSRKSKELEILELAKKAFQLENYKEALIYIDRILEINSNNLPAVTLKMHCQMLLSDMKGLGASLQRFLSEYPYEARIWTYALYHAHHTGMPEKVDEYMKKIYTFKRLHDSDYFVLITCLSDIGRDDCAEEYARKTYNMSPFDFDRNCIYALSLYNNGKKDLAIKIMRQMQRLYGEYATAMCFIETFENSPYDKLSLRFMGQYFDAVMRYDAETIDSGEKLNKLYGKRGKLVRSRLRDAVLHYCMYSDVKKSRALLDRVTALGEEGISVLRSVLLPISGLGRAVKAYILQLIITHDNDNTIWFSNDFALIKTVYVDALRADLFRPEFLEGYRIAFSFAVVNEEYDAATVSDAFNRIMTAARRAKLRKTTPPLIAYLIFHEMGANGSLSMNDIVEGFKLRERDLNVAISNLVS